MFFVSSVVLIVAAFAIISECSPQNDIGFPDSVDDFPENPTSFDGGLGPRQIFRPRQGPRPGADLGSPGFPGNNFGSSGFPGNNFRPNSPNNDLRPPRQQPGNNFRPSPPGNDFRPSNSEPGNDFRPSNSQPGSNNRPLNSRPGQTSTTSSPSSTTSTSAPGETTTRIPPRDPTNRIVYTVPCQCPYTRQYSPVCGTDGQTYGNLGVLQCSQRCGSDVQIFLMGACGRNNG